MAKFLQIIIASLFNNIQKLSSNNQIIIWAFLFIIQTAHANLGSQSPIYRSNFTISHKGNSFWHRSNQLGIYDKGGYASLSFYGSYNYLFDYGVSILGDYNNFNSPLMPIGFMSKNIKGYNFKIGRWEKSITAESDLSSGSLIRGNNAIPIPQISISLPVYKKYQILNYDFWIKGAFSHGWFSKGAYVKAPLLHEKYLYLKKSLIDGLDLSIGLVHEAIWGGETIDYGPQPQKLSDYFRVVFARSASSAGFVGEQVNVLGNHLGVWDISLDKKSNSRNYKLYYQHPFEDKSSAFQHFFDEIKKRKIPVNSFDGLFGVELYNKSGIISRFLYEYFNTMYQSGPQSAAGSDSTYGRDNYYNHYIYRSGWTYQGRVIGNPLFTLGSNSSNQLYIVNNRIRAHHIGLSGNISSQIDYKLLITFSTNYGTYDDNYWSKEKNKLYQFEGGLKQISALLQFDFSNVWDNLDIRISYAIDRGKLMEDSDGLLVSLNYNLTNLSSSH